MFCITTKAVVFLVKLNTSFLMIALNSSCLAGNELIHSPSKTKTSARIVLGFLDFFTDIHAAAKEINVGIRYNTYTPT